MDTEMMEMFQLILEKIDRQDKRFDAQEKRLDSLETSVKKEISESETRIMVTIENDVTKRLDSLFDGYQSVHEKQFVQEQEIKSLERRVDTLEVKVG